MCGICGIYSKNASLEVDRATIKDMCDVMMHRGPDDEGIYIENNVGLGMRRLSIIDVQGGQQPVFNEDKTVCVVQNGEIYNYKTLRNDLQSQGHVFSTQSDTEVIVHLYEEYGIDFVNKLNGMFAIAIWDSNTRRIVLVRDRLGQKPLYYTWSTKGLVFGSELKCLLACPCVPKQLNQEAVYHYFTLGVIPHPLTIYKDIQQLPPAGRAVVDGERLVTDQYWSPDRMVQNDRPKQQVIEELRDVITDAVRLRMISDVPLGAFLSGGLDSSIIVALMAQNSSLPVKTFHIDFAEPEYSERSYAREVADRYGTDHHELVVQPSAIEVLDDIVDSFDEPFGDSSAIPTFYVSRLTRQHVTVALAGDGGDELFGGYNRYRDILARRERSAVTRAAYGTFGRMVHRVLPRTAPGRRFFRSLGLSQHEYFAVGTNELETRELLAPDFLKALGPASTYGLLQPKSDQADPSDPLAPYTTLDLNQYLPDDILTKVDRMSMANSLEARAPLLDHRVVELAVTIPWDWKISGSRTKAILKETFASDLPAAITKPRKRGFSLPMAQWLRGELRPMLDESLHDSQIAASGIFRMNEIRALAREHMSGRRDRRSLLWRYMFFVRWWRRHYCDTSTPRTPQDESQAHTVSTAQN